MAYTIEIAEIVAKTIEKFATLNNYQLVGHIATLDFWQQQVENVLAMIDGYEAREHIRIRSQMEYIRQHDTRKFDREQMKLHREFPNDPSEDLSRVQPDRSTIDKETLQAKRRELADGFYHFVRRCNSEGLLSKEGAMQSLAACGIGLEPGDFRD